MRTYSQHKTGVCALEWLDKDTLVSSGIFDRTLKIWSISSGQTKKTINVPNPLFCLKFLNNNIHMAVLQFSIWNIRYSSVYQIQFVFGI